MSNPSPLNGQTVTIANYESGTVLDLDLRKDGPKNGTLVVGSRHTGSDSQKWKLEQIGSDEVWPTFLIRNVMSGTVLDLDCGGGGNGTKIHIWERLENKNQVWIFFTGDLNHKVFAIRNLQSNTVVDLNFGSKNDYTKVQGWDPEKHMSKPNRLWRIQSLDTPAEDLPIPA